MEQTKVILLPKEIEKSQDPQNHGQGIQVVELPHFKDLNRSKKYLVASDKLYDLKAIDGKSSPKSIIFENDTEGRIHELEQVLITTEYNFTYLLISLLLARSGGTTKQRNFITIENLIDNHDWLNKLPYKLIQKGLDNICDVLEQLDEFFYKVNPQKIDQFITTKIHKIIQYLQGGQTSLVSKLKVNLYIDSETEIPDNYMDLELRYQAIQLIKQNLVDDVDVPVLNEDFDELLTYKQEIVKKLTTRQLMASQPVVEAKPKPSNNAIKSKQKKPVKKVAVGKGALDSFFSKKK